MAAVSVTRTRNPDEKSLYPLVCIKLIDIGTQGDKL